MHNFQNFTAAGQKKSADTDSSLHKHGLDLLQRDPSVSAFTSPAASIRDDAAFDEGFQNAAPPASLVLGSCIKKAFQDASSRQEQCNIAIARKNSAAKQSATRLAPSFINKHVLAAAKMLTAGKKTVPAVLPPMIQVTPGSAAPERIDPRLMKRQSSLPGSTLTPMTSTEATPSGGHVALQHSLSMPVLTPEVALPAVVQRAGLSPIISSPRPTSPEIQPIKEAPSMHPSVLHRLSVGMSPTQDHHSDTDPIQSFVSLDTSVTVSDSLHAAPSYQPSASSQSSVVMNTPAEGDTVMGDKPPEKNTERPGVSNKSKKAEDNKSTGGGGAGSLTTERLSVDETVINLLQKYQIRKSAEDKAEDASSSTNSSSRKSSSVASDDPIDKKQRRTDKKTKRKRTESSHSNHSSSGRSLDLSDAEVDRIVKGRASSTMAASDFPVASSSSTETATGKETSKSASTAVKIHLTDLNFFPEPDATAHKRVRRKSETAKTSGKSPGSKGQRSDKEKEQRLISKGSAKRSSSASSAASHSHSAAKSSSSESGLVRFSDLSWKSNFFFVSPFVLVLSSLIYVAIS